MSLLTQGGRLHVYADSLFEVLLPLIEGFTFLVNAMSTKATVVLASPIAAFALWILFLQVRGKSAQLRFALKWSSAWLILSAMCFGFLSFGAFASVAGHVPNWLVVLGIVSLALLVLIYVGYIPFLIYRYWAETKQGVGP